MSSIWVRRPAIEDMAGYHIGTAVEHMGIVFTDVGDDFLTAKMPTNEQTKQPYGTIHGGASVVLAETLGSVGAAHCVDNARFRVFGQEINANHIRPNYEGWVYGTARPIHLGRQSHVWGIEIRNEAGKLTCISRITMAVTQIDKHKG
ncbi:MAG: hotdog fold thioesterase [Pseudomonadota bacterium]